MNMRTTGIWLIVSLIVAVSIACSNETVQVEVTRAVEVPVEVTRAVEVPVEVTREVEVPVEVTREVEVPVEVTRAVEVPVEVTRAVEVPVEVTRAVEVPVEVTREVEVPVEVTREVEALIEVTRVVEVPVEVTRVVEVPVEDGDKGLPQVTIDNAEEFILAWYGEISSEALSFLSCQHLHAQTVFVANEVLSPSSNDDSSNDDASNAAMIGAILGLNNSNRAVASMWRDLQNGSENASEEIYRFCRETYGIVSTVTGPDGRRYQIGIGSVDESTGQGADTAVERSTVGVRDFTFQCYDITTWYGQVGLLGHDYAMTFLQTSMAVHSKIYDLSPSEVKDAWEYCEATAG